MFASSVVDKENIQGDVLVSTPARKPLQMLQTISQNAVSEGTPTVLRKKTPKQRLSNIINTPASSRRQSRRHSKRQSVPLPLSKLAVSIFDDEMLTRSAMVDIPAAMTGKILENCEETESRELNEMLRKKVFETVTKMRERYEVCLAEKEKDLKEQNCIIEHLKTKVNILKQNQKDINKALVPTKTPEETQNTHEDEEVSLLVQHVLSKAVKDMEANNFTSGRQTDISVNDPITSVTEVDSMTSVNPLRCVSQEKLEIPVHIQQTNYSPTKHNNVSTSMTPTDHSKHTNVLTSMTPTDHAKHTNVSTSMTPTDHVNQDTMVSPIITCNTSVVTSPLVAVLQPEMTSQLPVETLRSELVSAAISNELLRSECDNLNRKVEDLESCLTEVRNLASKECGDYQERVDQLQKELEVAQEINYQMEIKKPHSVEEYEDVIQRLQKDVLLKEKQIVFYAKKASEADNLQKDLRRMYDKYNAEHKLYLAQEQKIKGLINEHDAKCSELETMRAEFTGIRMEFSEAKATIDEQEKERIVANKNEVKCCALEEQIETFQYQQKENTEFLEQERKGLEETNVELEKMVRKCSAELDATREALEMKTAQYEQLRESAHSSRTQLTDVQDELNAVQSQAYLVMLEQEKELTTVARVLEEAWERLNTMIDAVKEQALFSNEEKEKSGEEMMKETGNECNVSSLFKPSLVCSVLAAVSGGTEAKSDNSSVEEHPEEQSNSFVNDSAPSEAVHLDQEPHDDHFSLVDRALSFSDLLRDLEEHTCGEVAREQTQKHRDEILNLQNVLAETRKQYEIEINSLKQELASGSGAVKEVQRALEQKQTEMESLKLELQTSENNIQISREQVRDLGERYCRLIEQETENEALNENLRVVQRECERLKKERSMLEKDLNDTMKRLRETVETNEEPDVDKRKAKIQESFAELFQERLKLRKEVEKLRDFYSKSRMEKETFTHYNAKLETKATILANNLMKAEEEIFRLDGIIDRFCCVAKQHSEMVAQNKELCDLLQELNINIE